MRGLRLAGGNPIYTEYLQPGHVDACGMMMRTPVAVDWLLAQRRGVAPTNGPRLSIVAPTGEALYATGATNLDLAGTAGAYECHLTQLLWTNAANRATGAVPGASVWSVSGIPLALSRTNLLVVTATITNTWAPAYGGYTSFSDTLAVSCFPIRLLVERQDAGLALRWTGGAPPYCVQRTTNLQDAPWVDFAPDATPPVEMPSDTTAGFYRVVGR